MSFILLYGVRDKGIAKYRCSLNKRSKRKITSPRVNVIQEDVGAQTLFQSKMVLHISKEGRGHG